MQPDRARLARKEASFFPSLDYIGSLNLEDFFMISNNRSRGSMGLVGVPTGDGHSLNAFFFITRCLNNYYKSSKFKQ